MFPTACQTSGAPATLDPFPATLPAVLELAVCWGYQHLHWSCRSSWPKARPYAEACATIVRLVGRACRHPRSVHEAPVGSLTLDHHAFTEVQTASQCRWQGVWRMSSHALRHPTIHGRNWWRNLCFHPIPKRVCICDESFGCRCWSRIWQTTTRLPRPARLAFLPWHRLALASR